MKIENIKACVFDAYGTLFDVNSAAAKCKEKLGSKWEGFANAWRTTQLEYTWLRSLMKKHKNFWQITEDSLDHTMATFNIDKNNKPIGPPTNLPATKGFTELKSTLFLSLINTRIANGKPNSDKSWGTNSASICTTIGDAITANPNPSIPWTDDPIKINRAIKINSKRVRSKGRLNQALLLWA